MNWLRKIIWAGGMFCKFQQRKQQWLLALCFPACSSPEDKFVLLVAHTPIPLLKDLLSPWQCRNTGSARLERWAHIPIANPWSVGAAVQSYSLRCATPCEKETAISWTQQQELKFGGKDTWNIPFFCLPFSGILVGQLFMPFARIYWSARCCQEIGHYNDTTHELPALTFPPWQYPGAVVILKASKTGCFQRVISRCSWAPM